MKVLSILISSVLVLFVSCCNSPSDDTVIKDPLLISLEENMYPLDNDPLRWIDGELDFIDHFGDASVIGLGEATHGTKEFFEAKHRIFKYLVEHHDFRVFAIEADFGESIYLNQAVQDGNISDIQDIMISKMHFWTWKTAEVQQLLEWMCQFNQGKDVSKKIHYMGIDCQFNTYHPAFLQDYLEKSHQILYDFSYDILEEVESVSREYYANMSQNQYEELLFRVDILIDSVSTYEPELISNSSIKEFQLYRQLLNVIRQSLIVGYKASQEDFSVNFRDEFMAENVLWLLDYFDDNKVAVWAHNYHVADYPIYSTGSMGYYLNKSLGDNYSIIGFSFSRGSFTAVGMSGDTYTGLSTHSISADPKSGSLNEIFSRSQSDVFAVSVADLISYSNWQYLFRSNVSMLGIGSVYNGNPEDYYAGQGESFYDLIIYFDTTKNSSLLNF